jgi:glutathione-regulated potassium-efflux system protein KefB
LLLIAASIAVALFKHLGLGSVLGLLVAGIIVGPHSPGPYVTTHVEDVRHLTELGVVLLLFLIGLEMKPGRLWALRRNVFGLGSLQILLSGVVIAAYVAMYQSSWKTALLIGLTLALSSTAFIVQLLQERGEIASRYGSTAFAVLLMQDLAIVPLLALVPILSDTGALSSAVPLWKQVAVVIGMLGLVWGFGRRVVPFALERLSRQNNREGFFLVVMLAVFIAAWAMHQAGLSMALGAFMMGMLLSESRYSLQIQALVEPYKGLLMSLFFVAVGMPLTPVLVKDGDAMARRAGRPRPEGDEYRYHAENGESKARAILGGYGRVGHAVATLLQSSGVPFLAFDTNPAHVARGKADGFPVYYGDIGDLELLAAAGGAGCVDRRSHCQRATRCLAPAQ